MISIYLVGLGLAAPYRHVGQFDAFYSMSTDCILNSDQHSQKGVPMISGGTGPERINGALKSIIISTKTAQKICPMWSKSAMCSHQGRTVLIRQLSK